MTLIQALAKSEEFKCMVLNREAGILTSYEADLAQASEWPKEGWELDDTPSKVSFEALYLGSGKVEGMAGDVTAYTFKGNHVSVMPVGTKMKVTLEPFT